MRISFKLFLAAFIVAHVFNGQAYAQKRPLEFGQVINLSKITTNPEEKAKSLLWYDVNTSPETWSVRNNMLVCTGQPIGVMRSEKQFENFMLHIEWKHLEAGGNSGIFIWSAAKPGEENRLPDGVEVQMLELDWVNLNKQNGQLPPIAYVHGELFGVGGVKTDPDNPRGERSKSLENLCKGKGSGTCTMWFA